MVTMQASYPKRACVTNREVAELLGVTHSAISRIRSGDRMPSLDLMVEVSIKLNWAVEEQAYNRRLNTYRYEFEEVLAREYDRPFFVRTSPAQKVPA